MKFANFSQEAVAELLIYLADHEDFKSIQDMKNITKGDVKNMLAELAEHLKEKAEKQPIMRKSQLKQKQLGVNTSQVISKLTPKEEEILFQSFRISE